MLKYLHTKSNTLDENVFSDNFTNKKILVLGAGPSGYKVNWKELDYDSIVTTTHFFLNDDIRNLSNIVHVTLSEIVDFNHPNLHEFLNKNPNCTIALEPVPGRPFYDTKTFKDFEIRYRDRLVYYNTSIGTKEGAAGRLCYFVLAFNPQILYYVGIDGVSINPQNDPHDSFRTHMVGDGLGYQHDEFLKAHTLMAHTLYQYAIKNNVKIYNLGEGFDFNCSTEYSTMHFPLPQEIKQRIKL